MADLVREEAPAMNYRKLLAFSGCFLICVSSHAQTEKVVLNISDPRPVAAGLLEIQKRTPIPVNYEDTRLEWPCPGRS